MTDAVQAVVMPVAVRATVTTQATHDFWQGFRNARSQQERIRELEAALALAEQELAASSAIKDRLDDLSRAVELDAPGDREKIFAPIIGYAPYENRITLGRGRNQGVRAHQPIITADGLVGVIQTVDDETSQALLITSPALVVGGLVLGDSTVAVLVQGATAHRLVLNVMEDLEVHTGELVVTSGFSDYTPRDIPIGVIVEVRHNPEFGIRRAYVLPHVSISDYSEVIILK